MGTNLPRFTHHLIEILKCYFRNKRPDIPEAYTSPPCVCAAGWLAEPGVNPSVVPFICPSVVGTARMAVQLVSEGYTSTARALIVPTGMGVGIGVGAVVGVGAGQLKMLDQGVVQPEKG